MTRNLIALLFPFIICQATEVRAADVPAVDFPELATLSNYVGTSDVAITAKGPPFTSGQSTAQCTLGGRFVQQSDHVASTDGKTQLKITTLMTYDQEKSM